MNNPCRSPLSLLKVVNEGPPGPNCPLRLELAGAGPDPAAEAAPPLAVSSVFGGHRGRILLTYGLFNVENLLRLAQPWVLGLAIHGLLQASYLGLALFAVQHVAYVLLSAGRRAYDTRTFARISTELATRLVLEQRGRQIDISCVAARSALSRELVDFFERGLPFVLDTLYCVVGALVMLGLYDWVLVPISLMMLVPMGILSYVYGRTALGLNRQLNDELEREVQVIREGKSEEVRGHYSRVRGWRIRIMDRMALNFGLMEGFAFGLMAAALIRCCSAAASDPGQILAVFGYILIFSRSLADVPMLVEQVSRLRDICRRLRGSAAPPTEGASE